MEDVRNSTHEGILTPLQGVVIVAGENGFKVRRDQNRSSWTEPRSAMGLALADGVDNMEKETFKLETFVTTNWDL
jgi:hypothetical protein